MADVFANSTCGLPYVEAIADFNFVSSCALPDPPPPIYDCPDVDINIPLVGLIGPTGPQGFAGPCPTLNIQATAIAALGPQASVQVFVANGPPEVDRKSTRLNSSH